MDIQNQNYLSFLYSSLKQEIFSSGFINIKEWLQHLYKAQQYLQTQKVKNMSIMEVT